MLCPVRMTGHFESFGLYVVQNRPHKSSPIAATILVSQRARFLLGIEFDGACDGITFVIGMTTIAKYDSS